MIQAISTKFCLPTSTVLAACWQPSFFSVFLLITCWIAQVAGAEQPPEVEKAEFGEVRVVYKCGNIWMASQPSAADLQLMAERGITCVVTLRTDEEVAWDEQGTAEALGLDFRKFPISSIESLTDDVFAQTRKLFQQRASEPIFVHCGAAVRVAAVWAAYRVLDQGVALETALVEAEKIGLRSPKMQARVKEYVESQK